MYLCSGIYLHWNTLSAFIPMSRTTIILTELREVTPNNWRNRKKTYWEEALVWRSPPPWWSIIRQISWEKTLLPDLRRLLRPRLPLLLPSLFNIAHLFSPVSVTCDMNIESVLLVIRSTLFPHDNNLRRYLGITELNFVDLGKITSFRKLTFTVECVYASHSRPSRWITQ